MTETPTLAAGSRSIVPRLKVLYLLAVSAAVFTVPAWELTRPARWYVVPGLVGLQVLVLLLARTSLLDILRVSLRLKWLFAFLIACYLFLPGSAEGKDTVVDWQPLPNARSIPLNLTGLETASLMCLQIVTVILVSAVVRLTGSSTDFVDGLRGFGLPKLFVYSTDMTLALLGGLPHRGMGGGRRRKAAEKEGGAEERKRAEDRGWKMEGEKDKAQDGSGQVSLPRGRKPAGSGAPGTEAETTQVAPELPQAAAAGPSARSGIRNLLRGDVGFFVDSIERSLLRAREQMGQQTGQGLDERLVHDVSVISGIALAMMSLKMLKVLPSLPFMPGWKTLFFYPLYILAAHLTYSRWGGTTAGTIMGVLGYMQGDGKFGVLEIFKHLVPGLVIDCTWPVVRRLPRSVFVYCLLGLVTAIARTSTEFVIMLLAQARLEAFLFVVMTLVSNLVAGTLSGLVTFYILPAFRRIEPKAVKDAEPPVVSQAG